MDDLSLIISRVKINLGVWVIELGSVTVAWSVGVAFWIVSQYLRGTRTWTARPSEALSAAQERYNTALDTIPLTLQSELGTLAKYEFQELDSFSISKENITSFEARCHQPLPQRSDVAEAHLDHISGTAELDLLVSSLPPQPECVVSSADRH